MWIDTVESIYLLVFLTSSIDLRYKGTLTLLILFWVTESSVEATTALGNPYSGAAIPIFFYSDIINY